MRRATAVITAVLMTSSPPVYGWGDLGHRMVCDITWISLQEETRKKALEILDLSTQAEFAEMCNWADAYREGHRETAPWHYISVPRGATDVVMERDCPVVTSCIVREIERNFTVLKGAGSKAEKAVALKFLAHFVGDLHQPLHVGYAEDRRGSLISVFYKGEKWSMHGIWDYALVEAETLPPEKMVNRFRALTPGVLTFDWVEAPPLAWAQESLLILRSPATGYVGNPGGLELNEIYLAQNQSVAMDQISKAGARLAHLLETALQFWP